MSKKDKLPKLHEVRSSITRLLEFTQLRREHDRVFKTMNRFKAVKLIQSK